LTEIAFHTGVAERIGYACRLLRKAVRQGLKVQALADEPELGALDQALWTFDAHDFVPHVRLRPGQAIRPELQRTPLWLAAAVEDWPSGWPAPDLLVNCGVNAAIDPARSRRLIEIVSLDDADRAAARQRWRRYAAAGNSIKHHEIPV
jgi:DNA polymerase-3 subunit chi